MTNKISRRKLLAGAGAATAGFAAGSLAQAAGPSGETAPQAPQRSTGTKLPDVWGQDFLYQWSPPTNVRRDLTPAIR